MWIRPTIGEQRKTLTALFEPPMLNLSKQCINFWFDLEGLDQVLSTHFASVPHCHLVYAIDKFGKQVSSNISASGIDPSYRNQDLSRRPYSVSLYPKRHFMLSSVYISQTTGRPCISAVQPIIDEQQFLGFVVADFDIRHLPLPVTPSKDTQLLWQPSHFNTFHKQSQPQRVTSPFDKCLNDVNGILNKLISEHGVFHCTLHYLSGQTILWQINEPYQYRLYEIEQLLAPDMYQTYPRQTYPINANLSQRQVRQVLERFSSLRLGDDSIYIRTGSLNIMNGMVSLSLSGEGSQYMSAETFLGKDLSFWFGQKAVNEN